MDNKILLITHHWGNNHFGGRQGLSKVNKKCMDIVFKNELFTYYIDTKKDNFLRKCLNYLYFYIDGVSRHDISKIILLISEHNIKTVYLDGSTFGILARILKKIFNINILTFYHHCETSFYWQLLKEKKTLKYFLLFILVYYNETLSAKYSSLLLIMTQRDKQKILHRRSNKESFMLPMVIDDTDVMLSSNHTSNNPSPYLLFVGGGGLFGNYYGVKWFIENIVDEISYNFVIVGDGYEDLIKKYFNKKNVIFLGKCDELSEIYYNSAAVVAPIFFGSGMKTKVAEAIMFGKYVFGSNEAFIGYEDSLNKIGTLCNNKKDFAFAINNFQSSSKTELIIRNEFIEKYSLHSQIERFKIINQLKEKLNDAI